MDVAVKLFAGLAERVGQREVVVQLPDGATIADLRIRMQTLYPQADPQWTRALAAINRAYADDDRPVQPHDEIAFIPPVSGGSPDADPPVHPSCLITPEPLDLQVAYAALQHPRFGGVTIFCGTVREWTGARRTNYLDYEAYEAMAMAQMAAIEADVQAQWPGIATVQWHRIGQLYPTDIAVICGAASPHRDVAFAAARQLIERVKAEVPIWKKEIYAEGDPQWRENES